MRDLARSAAHRAVLERFRAALREHLLAVRDTGFLPENELAERSRGTTPYAMARDRKQYPLERILVAAETASSLKPEAAALTKSMGDPDSAVRFWAVTGLLARGAPAVAKARGALVKALGDKAASVRIQAAEALGRYGDAADTARALDVLAPLADWRSAGLNTAVMALNAIDNIGEKARPIFPRLASLPKEDAPGAGRYANSCPILMRYILLKQ
jgi:hypothetical protein